MVDKVPNNGFEYAWGALSFSLQLKEYIDIEDPHIGYAVKNSIENNEIVQAFRVKGQYFDCGTPNEYVDLLKEAIL
jgi:UTP-glucose-1-phosphate uridylyltransferase